MNRKWMLTIWAVVMIAAMVACASPPKPFVYHDDRDEKPGPGLFSGEAGGFVIYGGAAKQAEAAEKAPSDADVKAE